MLDLLEYRSAVVNLNNSMNGWGEDVIPGKDDILREMSKAEQMRDKIESCLSKYEKLSLRESVVLSGIRNPRLMESV